MDCTDACTPTKFETIDSRSLLYSKNAAKNKRPNEPSVTVAFQEWHHLRKRKRFKQKTVLRLKGKKVQRKNCLKVERKMCKENCFRVLTFLTFLDLRQKILFRNICVEKNKTF